MNNAPEFSEWHSKLLCEECAVNPFLTIRTEKAIVTYCVHNKAGGFVRLKSGKPAGPWTFFQPISVHAFFEGVLEVKRCAQTLEKVWGVAKSERTQHENKIIWPSLMFYWLTQP